MTDLSLVASRLSRAADKLEKLTDDTTHRRRWYCERDTDAIWPGEGDRIDVDHAGNKAFITALDPLAVAALVPLLRIGAEMVHGGWHCDSVNTCKHRGCWTVREASVFAALLLGEEEQ